MLAILISLGHGARRALTLSDRWRLRTGRSARAEEGRRQLVLMNVAAATERMDEGDFLLALPHLGEALKLDQGDPAREEGHRYRLGSVLERTPRIIQLCPHEGIVTSASFSSDGQRIVTACADGRVRVWDLASTEPGRPH